MRKANYDPIIFCSRESLDMEKFIVATYIAQGVTRDILVKAGAMAVEQTTGTWVRVPDETDEVRMEHVGRVINCYNVPGYEISIPSKNRTWIMQIAYPWINFGQCIPEMLSSVMGNISEQDNFKLIDLEFPKSFTNGFAGPQFGVQGVREVTQCFDTPPILAMIKPCNGIPIPVIERQMEELCRAGVNMVKDDELIADPPYAPFYERLKANLAVADRVYQETGHKTVFVPNITDRQDKILEKAHRAVEMGAEALMLNVHACGYGILGAIAEDKSLNVPLLAHAAYSGVHYASPTTGLASQLILGKFMRLEGADIVVYSVAYGKLPTLRESYIRAGQYQLDGFAGYKNTLPCPAAGMNPGMVPLVMDDLGPDIVIGAGAAMHAHPLGLEGGVKALRQASESWLKNIPIEEYAKDHKELEVALKVWPQTDPDANLFELTE